MKIKLAIWLVPQLMDCLVSFRVPFMVNNVPLKIYREQYIPLQIHCNWSCCVNIGCCVDTLKFVEPCRMQIDEHYHYTYDPTNRLSSTYSILDGQFGDYFYTESYRYDKHSNITQLDRWDNRDAMNSLHLSYNGNQLREVTDNGYGPAVYDSKCYHDANDSGDDFAYDANGNIRYDKDRGIAAIRYNLLNLPDTIQFTNGNQIIHTYDAAGNRLRTAYYTRKVTTTVPFGNTLPVGTTANYYATHDIFHRNCVYHTRNATSKDYAIEFVHNAEGYIRYLAGEEHYHFYYIKDHLGSIREMYG